MRNTDGNPVNAWIYSRNVSKRMMVKTTTTTTTTNNLFKRFLLLTVILAFGVVMCFMAFGCNQSRMERQKKEQCILTVEQLPTLRGFKLGQSTAEIRKRFPKLPNIQPDEYGRAHMRIYVDEYMSDPSPMYEIEKDSIKVKSMRYPELKGVHAIFLTFVDDKVAKFEIRYPYDSAWSSNSDDEYIRNRENREILLKFATSVSHSLNIKDEWEHVNVMGERGLVDTLRVSCKGFYVIVGFLSGRPLIMMEDLSATNLVSTRINDDEGKKRKSFRP